MTYLILPFSISVQLFGHLASFFDLIPLDAADGLNEFSSSIDIGNDDDNDSDKSDSDESDTDDDSDEEDSDKNDKENG